MNKNTSFAYTIAFSNEGCSVIKFVNKLLRYTNKQNDNFFFLIDKKTSIITKKYLIQYEKSHSNISILDFSRTKCFSETKLSGLNYVRNFQYTFDLDGNLSHDCKEILNFKKKIFSKKYDCIIGTRFHKLGNYKIDKFNKIQRFLLSFVGTKLCKILLGLNFSDNTGGYICLSSKAIKKILNQKIYSKAHFYHVEIKNIIKDLPNSEIPIIYKKSDTKISNKTILIALLNLGRLSINRFFQKLPVVNSS